MFTLSKKSSIHDALQSIGTGVKKSSLLSGSWQGSYAVAAIVLDDIQPPAEVHVHAADVWILLSGNARFILGGNMVDAVEKKPGELSAASIQGGEEISVEPGDVIDIPQGVPHQIDVRGGRAEFLILKININDASL